VANVAWTIAVGAGGLAGVIAITLWLPAFLGFVVVIALAMLWCIWLERHPIS
jgi:hypothetical protein